MKAASRRYYYPVRNPHNPMNVMLVEISEDVYRAIYPEIWRTRKREQVHGRCVCPQGMLWKCDADCLVCSYHAEGDKRSLDQEVEMHGDHFAAPDSETSDLVADQLLLQQLLQRLEELCPGAMAVGEMKLEGKSERSALEDLHMSRMTYRNRLKKAEKILRDEFGEMF